MTLLWKFFSLSNIPTNTKLTLWYEHEYPIFYFEYNDSIYIHTHTNTILLFPNSSLILSTHLDPSNHYLALRTPTNVVRLLRIPTLEILQEWTLGGDFVPHTTTLNRLIYKERLGVSSFYCLDEYGTVLYALPISGTLLTYAHTLEADYFVYRDKIVKRVHVTQKCTIRRLPFWISSATISFILTVPHCFGVSENGRLFSIDLWKLFGTNEDSYVCELSVYTYLPRASIGFDVWSSEDVSVVGVSKSFLEKASAVQRSGRRLSFPVVTDSSDCGDSP